MQTNHLNAIELESLLCESSTKILSIVEQGATRMHVLEFDGQDVLVFSDSSKNATVVYPPECFDAESGGSIHDHARAMLQAEGNSVAA